MQHGLFFSSQRRNPNSLKFARRRIDDLLTDRREIEDLLSQFHRLRISTRTTLAQLLTEAHSHGRRERFPTVYPLRFAPAGFVNRRSTSRRIGSGGTCRDRSRNSRERERWSRGDNTVKTYGQLQAAEIRACPFSSKESIEEGVVFPIV